MGEPAKGVAWAVEEVKKRPESESATGILAHGSDDESEENDADGEGFQTASEGRDSDEERTHADGRDSDEERTRADGRDSDEESTQADSRDSDEESTHDEFKDDEAVGREVTDEEIVAQVRRSDGSENEESNSRQGEIVETEEKPRSEEEEKQDRQQRIDEANAAKAEGNSLYADGMYYEALSSYERGLTACPLNDPEDSAVKEIRAVLHSNRAACYSAMQNSEQAVKESTKALDLNPNYMKALVRRYQGREKLESYEEAITDVKRVLELDPGNSQAQASLRRLTPLAEEKREKLKNEMLDKLKEAGNSILGRFGMSIDNFKTVQDPNTGSYSIQFQR